MPTVPTFRPTEAEDLRKLREVREVRDAMVARGESVAVYLVQMAIDEIERIERKARP